MRPWVRCEDEDDREGGDGDAGREQRDPRSALAEQTGVDREPEYASFGGCGCECFWFDFHAWSG